MTITKSIRAKILTRVFAPAVCANQGCFIKLKQLCKIDI
jgi:hypothetical protein